MPKVSVIIPVYNVEKYLRECLDSVINQTLKDIEIICVDDGSTDNSLNILNEYASKDKRIIVLTQKNQGAGAARNKGLKIASGEYIYFMDSDDFLELNAIEILYKQITATKADICYFKFYGYNQQTQDREYNEWSLKTSFLKKDKLKIFSKADFPNDIFQIGTCHVWTKLYLRSFIQENKVLFQNLPSCNDVYFALTTIALANKITYVDKALTNYRINTYENISATRGKHFKSIFIAYEKIIKEFKEKEIFKSVEVSLYKQIGSNLEYELGCISKKDLTEFMKMAKQIMPKNIFHNWMVSLKEKNTSNLNKYFLDILIVEFNNFHGECLPGYIKYFLDLGYVIDVLANTRLEEENALYLFNDNPNVRIIYSEQKDIINTLNSKFLDNYKYCFFNTDRAYSYNKSIFSLIKRLHCKTKYLCTDHGLERLSHVKRNAIPVILKSFNENQNKFMVNPHYFGEITKHKKNNIINFIVVGNIENKRKNYKLVINTVQKLLDNNINNFKITIIGQGEEALQISKSLMHYFDIKGRVSYSTMYEEVQKADYFLTLLDPDNSDHTRYVTRGTSGSFQLIYGFNLPCLIEKTFAEVHQFNTSNAIVYEGNQQLYDAMVRAITLNDKSYNSLKENLNILEQEIYKQSLYNLKNLLSQYPWYRFSFNGVKLVLYTLVQKIFSIKNSPNKKHKVITILFVKIKIKKEYLRKILSIKNQLSINNKWHKVIYILGIKISLRNKRKERREADRFEKEQMVKTLDDLKWQNNKLREELQTLYTAKKDFIYKLYKYCPKEKREEALKDWFLETTGEKLNLENPKTFNEKIQWLKLYDSTPEKTRLADKYLVRDWVKEKIGEEYLIPLLGAWDKFEDINFDELPDQFVLKCNHGSGYNIIVKDKSKLDIDDARKKINKWMNEDFAFKCGFELHYSPIQRKIIAEKYISKISEAIYDYRFFCFNGICEQIWLDVSSGTPEHERKIYDKNWNELNIEVTWPRHTKHIEKPKNLDKMIELAQLMSKDFAMVRVDFYNIENKIYFGEMTFTSMSGTGKFNPESANLQLGELITLPKK